MKKSTFLSSDYSGKLNRRIFIKQSVLVGSSILVYSNCTSESDYPVVKGTILKKDNLLGGLKEVEGPDYLPNAIWYEGESPGDGIAFNIPDGSLASEKYITVICWPMEIT